MKSLVLSNILIAVLLTIGMLSCFVAAAEDQCTIQQRACGTLPEAQRKDCLIKTEPHCKAAACAVQILVTCQSLDDKDCALKTKCTDEKCKEQIPADPKACEAYSAGWTLRASMSFLIACFSISIFT